MLLSKDSSHVPGDVRALGAGDWITFVPSAEAWSKYWDAIGVAVCRGAELRIRYSTM
jgi:hypothetical protein